MPAKITPTKLRHKKFVDGIVSGQSAIKSYREAYPNASKSTVSVEACRLLEKPSVQEELQKRLALITPENIIDRIDNIARSAPLPETQLKALIALGNTIKASIFKDNATTNVNVLNVLDVEDLRKRLEEHKGKRVAS